MACSPLCYTRRSKDEILLRVRLLDTIPVGESEIRRRCHRELPRGRYQYVHVAFIRRHIHVPFSLGKRLPLDAPASDDPQKAPQRSDRLLPPCSIPFFGDLPLSSRSGASLGRSSRLGFYWIPDAKLCEAL